MTAEPDDDAELGPPIAELADFTEEPRRGFLGRVRRSIERRRLGSQFTGLAWHGLAAVAVELLSMLVNLFGGARSAGDPPPGPGDDRDPPEAPTA